jgi:hypothetical protein
VDRLSLASKEVKHYFAKSFLEIILAINKSCWHSGGHEDSERSDGNGAASMD